MMDGYGRWQSGGSLRHVLEESWEAALPLAERRRLLSVAVGRALHVPEKTTVLGDDVVLFERALAAAATDTERIGVAAAKDRLRSLGRHDLAARLSRLSKRRNGAAHPDVQLPEAIAAAVGGMQAGSLGERETAGYEGSAASSGSCEEGAQGSHRGEAASAEQCADAMAFYVGD